MDREMIDRCEKAVINKLNEYDIDLRDMSIVALILVIIDAMREPTEKMTLGADRYIENYVTFEEANNIYKSYIDAIYEE